MPYIGKARISAHERASCYGVFNSTQINRLKKDPYASERAQVGAFQNQNPCAMLLVNLIESVVKCLVKVLLSIVGRIS